MLLAVRRLDPSSTSCRRALAFFALGVSLHSRWSVYLFQVCIVQFHSCMLLLIVHCFVAVHWFHPLCLSSSSFCAVVVHSVLSFSDCMHFRHVFWSLTLFVVRILCWLSWFQSSRCCLRCQSAAATSLVLAALAASRHFSLSFSFSFGCYVPFLSAVVPVA